MPDADVRAALDRIVASDAVRGSRRTVEFLRFTVAEALAGRAEGLTERTVALGAFGRPPGFDPRLDPSVRVQARRVRAALERYYAGAGIDDGVWIEFPKGGYRPRVRPRPPRPAERDGRRTTGPAVAVVSLTDLTPGGSHDHLAPGLSETLVAGLARFPGCRVIGPVTPVPVPAPGALGARYGAEFVLMGSTRVRGDAVRVAIRLVTASTGETAWARVFDRDLRQADAFQVEDEIVAEVTAALADYHGVIRNELAAGSVAAETGDPLVHDAILRYYGYLDQTATARFLPTVRALEEAARREPGNPLVLAMLAGMNLVGHIDGLEGVVDPVERARELSARALRADPDNPHAIAAVAWLSLAEGRVPDAHAALERLLAICPDHPTFLYRAGFAFAVSGEWERGVDLIRASMRLNDDHPGYLHFFPAMDLVLHGDDAGALERALLVETPGGHLGPLARAVALARLGRVEDAHREVEALRAAVPGFDDDRETALRRMLMPEPLRTVMLDAIEAVPGGR